MRPTRRALVAGLLAAPMPLLWGAAPPPSGRRLILVSAYGGWDTAYALDPKPDAPVFDSPPGEVRRYADHEILSSPDRPSVDAFFARAADITAVIKGISVRSLSHPQCTRKMLTGGSSASAPDFVAIAAAARGSDRALPYLVASPAAFAGPYAAQSAYAGATNQLSALIDPALEPARTDPSAAPFAPGADDEAAIADWLRVRAEREADGKGLHGDNAARVADFVWSSERAETLPGMGGPFGQAGTRPTFEDLAAQAVAALSQRVAWGAAIDSGLDFDTHVGNFRQAAMHETLFDRLGTLLTLLEDAPGDAPGTAAIDDTAVVVVSEMTRTPGLTAGGGKDHWPFATLLAFGGGIRGGRAYGGTGDDGVGLPVDLASGDVGGDRLLEPGDVLAGLLTLAGVDPAPYFPEAEVFRAFVA